MYAGDYDAFCPIADGNVYFYGVRSGSHGSFKYNLIAGGFLHEYVGNTALICPVWKIHVDTDLTEASGTGGVGYNRLVFSSTIDDEDTSISNGRTAPEMISRPTEIVMFGDAAMGTTPTATANLVPKGLGMQDKYGTTHFRHNDLANIAWADGHVSSVRYRGGNDSAKTGYFDDTWKYFDRFYSEDDAEGNP